MAFVSKMAVILIRDLLHSVMSSVYWDSLGGNSQIFSLLFHAPTTLSIDAANDEESCGPIENKKGTKQRLFMKFQLIQAKNAHLDSKTVFVVIEEDEPKRSYAFIVKVMKDGCKFSSCTS